jgi:hypothetical protein
VQAGAIVHDLVDIARGRFQVGQNRMVSEGLHSALGIDVGAGIGLDRSAAAAAAHAQVQARSTNGCGRGPGNDNFTTRVGAELQMDLFRIRGSSCVCL